MKQRILAVAGLLAIALGTVATSDAQVLQAADRGWYTDLGTHYVGNDNYFTGTTTLDPTEGTFFRSFFVFDIPTLAAGESYRAATLSLWNSFADGMVTNEIFSLLAVDGSIADLVTGTAGTNGFNDLGDGLNFGAVSIDGTDGNWINIDLNAAGLAAINAKQGQRIAFGGVLTNFTGTTDNFVFAFTGGGNPAESVLTVTVPEPGEWAAMGILGAGLAGLVIRKRRKP